MAAQEKPQQPHRFLCLPSAAWRVLYDYCQQTSLHGLKYVSSLDLLYIERYLWLLIFLISLVTAAHLIWEVWLAWRDEPFFITFDSHMTPIWEVPFPAVTVCPHIAVKRSAIDLSSTNNNSCFCYNILVQCVVLYEAERFCSSPAWSAPSRLLCLREYFMGNEFYDFIREAAPSCKEILKECTFLNKRVDCCDLFHPVITRHGLCYNFNNLPFFRIMKNLSYVPYPDKYHPPNARYWTPDNGYPRPDLRGDPKSHTFPLWEQVAGENFGLTVELYQNTSEKQDECTGTYAGYWVLLSNPADLPVSSKLEMRVVMNRETNIMLTPSALKSTPELSPIDPRMRSCVFSNEKPLYYFEQYTDSNCNLECFSIYFIRQCGCVPFYLIHALTRAAMERQMQNIDSTIHPCSCFKGCQELSYKYADFYTDFEYRGVSPAWANGSTVGRNQATRLTVYFKSNQFLGKHRALQYTDLKFAGTCGGLLSLFLGFSVISAIEAVYGFLLRPLSRALHRLLCLPPAPRHNAMVVTPVLSVSHAAWQGAPWVPEKS